MAGAQHSRSPVAAGIWRRCPTNTPSCNVFPPLGAILLTGYSATADLEIVAPRVCLGRTAPPDRPNGPSDGASTGTKRKRYQLAPEEISTGGEKLPSQKLKGGRWAKDSAMKAAHHRLVGYDRQTELEKFEVTIPRHIFAEVSSLAAVDDDDPDAVGCHELTRKQAHRIAIKVHRSLPSGLDFFLEGFAA